MTYVVTENCIKCKFQDCVAVCPVDCFYEGENFLVIHPEECIDCAVCEPACPADAIKADTEPDVEKWLAINAKYSRIWPNITQMGAVPPDAQEWNGKPNKAALLITGSEPAAPHAKKPIYDPGPNVVTSQGGKYEFEGAQIGFTAPVEGEERVALEPRSRGVASELEIDGLYVRRPGGN